jgi:hypothetical protein
LESFPIILPANYDRYPLSSKRFESFDKFSLTVFEQPPSWT